MPRIPDMRVEKFTKSGFGLKPKAILSFGLRLKVLRGIQNKNLHTLNLEQLHISAVPNRWINISVVE